jgi:hypothetical protein
MKTRIRKDRIDAWYGSKEWIKLLNPPGWPASLGERLVFSVLADRARFGEGLNQRAIGDRSGLNVGRTVPAALKSLEAKGLVTRAGYTWSAVEPGPEQFGEAKFAAPHWADRYAYVRWHLSAEGGGLPVNVNSVYWTLLSFSKDALTLENFSQRTASTLLGLSPDTVGRCLVHLERLGFFDILASGRSGSTFAFHPPDEARLAYFRDATPVSAAAVKRALAEHVERIEAKERAAQDPALRPFPPADDAEGGVADETRLDGYLLSG